MKSQIYVGYKLNSMEVMLAPFFNRIGDRPVALDNDAERLLQQLDTMSNSPSHPYMLKTLTVPEMTIINRYTFDDSQYSGIAKYPQSSSLAQIRQTTRHDLIDETVIKLAGDDIHCGIEIRFNKYQAISDMYLKMCNIALDRGELLAEYQRALQRFPNTEGVKEWYQAIAAADPNKYRRLYEGHYIEHYVDALEQCKEQMPQHTPNFILVYNAIIKAAEDLSSSVDDKTASLFKDVRQIAEDKLAEGYHEWGQSMHPDTSARDNSNPEYSEPTEDDAR